MYGPVSNHPASACSRRRRFFYVECPRRLSTRCSAALRRLRRLCRVIRCWRPTVLDAGASHVQTWGGRRPICRFTSREAHHRSRAWMLLFGLTDCSRGHWLYARALPPWPVVMRGGSTLQQPSHLRNPFTERPTATSHETCTRLYGLLSVCRARTRGICRSSAVSWGRLAISHIALAHPL